LAQPGGPRTLGARRWRPIATRGWWSPFCHWGRSVGFTTREAMRHGRCSSPLGADFFHTTHGISDGIKASLNIT
jgi:hypothetical protein